MTAGDAILLGEDQEGSTARTEAPASEPIPDGLMRRIAYAEGAIPQWQAGLREWERTGVHRGKRVDGKWLERERRALDEFECEYALWLHARERMRNGL